MSDQSSNLTLPYLAPAQAQKHVTVNQALQRLDAVVQLSVVSATTSAQPASPADGAVYILPAGKTGAAWGGMANEALAYYRDGAWEAITPREGWLAFVKDTGQVRVYTGSAWSQSAARTALGAYGAGDNLTVSNIFGGSAAAAFTIAAEPVGTFPNGGYCQFFGSASGPGTQTILAAGVSSLVVKPTSLQYNANNVFHGGANCLPTADIGANLGSGSFRFGTVFAVTGTINTSDAREKTALAPIPESVKRAVRRVVAQVGVFQWNEAVARKGANGARLHVGVTAQAVRDAFLAEGEDPARWALFCADPIVEEVVTAQAAYDESGVMIRDAVRQTRPVLDATGAPLTRLGVRADQLMWLALAALSA